MSDSKHFNWLLVITFVTFIFSSRPSLGQKQFVEYKGVILSAKDSLPIVGAKVKSANISITTDKNGGFSIILDSLNSIVNIYHKKYDPIQCKLKLKYFNRIYLKEAYKIAEMQTKSGNGRNISFQSIDQVNAQCLNSYNVINNDDTQEEYAFYSEGGYKNVKRNPLSTISVDIDQASYSNVRRFLNEGQLPPVSAVKIEEMVNYFKYDFPLKSPSEKVNIYTEIGDCPWNKEHRLLMVGLKAKEQSRIENMNSNIVFLVDVSGSMSSDKKLPMVKTALKMLVNSLKEADNIALVTYSDFAKVEFQGLTIKNKSIIIEKIENLEASGSTNGSDGLQKAYDIAKKNVSGNSNNRIVICTDGDFNVGPSSVEELKDLVKLNRDNNIFLSVVGFGTGNLKDNRLEAISHNGNGQMLYVDNLQEAYRVFVSELSATMFTVAQDVKLQIEFNPVNVQAYRLVGYENRILHDEDFNNDKVDAADLGAGHYVTVFYELVPPGAQSGSIDPLKYSSEKSEEKFSKELATVKFRYKIPGEPISKIISTGIFNSNKDSSSEFKFASAVSMFGMILNHSEYLINGTYKDVIELAVSSKGIDNDGYRAEFIRLVEIASSLK